LREVAERFGCVIVVAAGKPTAKGILAALRRRAFRIVDGGNGSPGA
jgi:DNA-binding transcriptional regulator LsrR (DeoR family)